MKKKLTLIVLNLFFFSSFAQNISEEIDPIQKFIEATVQIPFQAKLSNVQGVVAIRIIMGNDNLPEKYEIAQTLSEDCDKEALRVVKLINPKYLNDRLAGKKRIILQVPFFNPSLLFFDNGYLIEYFDKNRKPYIGNEPTYIRRYLVDTLSGMIKGDVEYFTYQDKKPALFEVSNLSIDTSKYVPEPFENPSDSTIIYSRIAMSNLNFPTVTQGFYKNGKISIRHFNNETYRYFPNGSIESVSTKISNEKEDITKTIKWFSNGLMASVITTTSNDNGSIDRYLAVWDIQGKQIVQNGEGNCEYFERENEEMILNTGLIKEGLKEGQWKGKTIKGEVLFEEIYKKGKFIKGVSFSNGQSSEYENPDQIAEFIGGISNFSKLIKNNLRYPASAVKANAQGKVFVHFTVCTDGTLCDYNILKGIGFGCDKEAIRVIQLSSGKWKPGRKRGKIVKTRFTAPINYALSD